jgi:hypothetical protein
LLVPERPRMSLVEDAKKLIEKNRYPATEAKRICPP